MNDDELRRLREYVGESIEGRTEMPVVLAPRPHLNRDNLDFFETHIVGVVMTCKACGAERHGMMEFGDGRVHEVVVELTACDDCTLKPGGWVDAVGIPGAPRRRVERVATCALLSDGRASYEGGIPWEYWPLDSITREPS